MRGPGVSITKWLQDWADGKQGPNALCGICMPVAEVPGLDWRVRVLVVQKANGVSRDTSRYQDQARYERPNGSRAGARR